VYQTVKNMKGMSQFGKIPVNRASLPQTQSRVNKHERSARFAFDNSKKLDKLRFYPVQLLVLCSCKMSVTSRLNLTKFWYRYALRQ